MTGVSEVGSTTPPVSDILHLPPGTIYLKDVQSDGHLVYMPQPSNDPNDPLNWTSARKYTNFAIISFYTLMIFVVLDVGTVCWNQWVEELGVTYDDLTNAFAANLAGLAVGCILFIPFALKYGRRPVYLASVTASLAACIWQAKANNVVDLIGSSLAAGIAGAASEALVQMTVGDMFFVHQRGTFNGIYLFCVTVGAYLGPVASGYIVDSQGWRWLYWWCAIFLAVSVVSFIFFYEDTKFIPAIEGQNASTVTNVQDRNGDDSGSTKGYGTTRVLSAAQYDAPPLKTYRQRMAFCTVSPGSALSLLNHMFQPFLALSLIPAVAFTALQYGSVLAWFSVLATSQPVLFGVPPYNFSATGLGLLSLPSFIGSLFGAFYGGPLSDWSVIFFARRNKGIYEPEMRLYLSFLPILLGPAGIWLFGYSAVEGMHWIIPCVGLTFFGFSLTALADTSLTYLADSYAEIIGDALVGVAFVRNGLSTVIVFALTPWVNAIGFRNMFLSAGFLALAINLLAIPMVIWGKTFRIHFAGRYAAIAQKQYNPRKI